VKNTLQRGWKAFETEVGSPVVGDHFLSAKKRQKQKAWSLEIVEPACELLQSLCKGFSVCVCVLFSLSKKTTNHSPQTKKAKSAFLCVCVCCFPWARKQPTKTWDLFCVFVSLSVWLLLRTISHQRRSKKPVKEKAVECHLAMNLGLRLRKKAKKRKKERGSLYQTWWTPATRLETRTKESFVIARSKGQSFTKKTKKEDLFLLSDPSSFCVPPLLSRKKRERENQKTKKFTVKAKGKSWQKRKSERQSQKKRQKSACACACACVWLGGA